MVSQWLNIVNMSPILTNNRAYPPEIIPLYIRSKAVSLATFFNWACNFALTFFTPPAFQNIQWKVRTVLCQNELSANEF